MNIQINLLDFINYSGGMYNGITYINGLIEIYPIYVEYKTCERVKLKNVKYLSNLKSPHVFTEEDSDGILLPGGQYSYGYLRKNDPSFMKLFIMNYDGNYDGFLKEIYNKFADLKEKKEKLYKKNIDIDPFGEEDWGF